MADPRKLREMILDQAEAHDLKPEKIIAQTSMPAAYFEALITGQPHRLPAYPYLRAYLYSLADLLGISREELVAAYKRDFSEKFSGAHDKLPGNRFALPMNKRRYLVTGGVALLLIVVYVISHSGFFGTPSLRLDIPPAAPDPYIVEAQIIELKGAIEPGDTLLVNGQDVPVAVDGAFTRLHSLSPELNSIEFVVRRFLGKEIRIVRQVYYQEAASSSTDGSESMGEDLP